MEGRVLVGSMLRSHLRCASNEILTPSKHKRCHIKHKKMAGTTGFEPATTGSTVRCANQLRHVPTGLKKMVGAEGIEPSTFWSRTKRATRLRYAPMMMKSALKLTK